MTEEQLLISPENSTGFCDKNPVWKRGGAAQSTSHVQSGAHKLFFHHLLHYKMERGHAGGNIHTKDKVRLDWEKLKQEHHCDPDWYRLTGGRRF